MTRLAFLDIETTGLDCQADQILEVAYILDDTDPPRFVPPLEVHFSLSINEAAASQEALQLNGYYTRRDALDLIQVTHAEAVHTLKRHLSGRVIVGNNVQFDLGFLRELLDDAPWHYHPIDLKALVAGYFHIGHPPWNTQRIAEEVGVKLPTDAHTALADARWNRKVYWEIFGEGASY